MAMKSDIGDESSGKAVKNRIDFEKGVPELLFKRAGGHCSVPRCKRPTVGPFIESSGAANMGTACHIFSAAENGPRGRGGMDVKFISSVENGIWCCNYHGSLIDKAKGQDYSAADLFSWKKLAEARVLKQMNDIPSPLGWVESIEFTHFARRSGLPKLNLSRYSLLTGANGSGKSVLMEVAASVSNGKYGERFFGSQMKMLNGTWQPALFRAEVVYSTVDSFDKKITIEIRNNILTRTEGKIPCLLPPGDIEVIFASDDTCRRQEDEDDVDFMMRVLSIDRSTLIALAKIGTKTIMPGEIDFRNAQDEDDDGNFIIRKKLNGKPYTELVLLPNGRDHSLSFNSLSGGEQGRLIIDMMITKAREVCKQRLTLLLIDDIISNFDDFNFINLLTKLAQEDFQSVVTLPPGRTRNTLEMIDGGVRLKNFDYLEPWRLRIVDALGAVEARAINS